MDQRKKGEAEDKEVLAALLDAAAARLRKEATADRTEHRPNLTVLKGGKAGAIILGLLALPGRAREHWATTAAATAVVATAALGATYVVTRPPAAPPGIQAEEPDPHLVAPEVEVGPHTAPPTAAATSTPPSPAGRGTPPIAGTVQTTAATVTPTEVALWPTSSTAASTTPPSTTEAAPTTQAPDPGQVPDPGIDTPTPTARPDPTVDPTSTPGPGTNTPTSPPPSPPPGICVWLPGIHLCVVLPIGPHSTVD